MKVFFAIILITISLFSCRQQFDCHCNYQVNDSITNQNVYRVERKNREAACNSYEYQDSVGIQSCEILYLK